MATVTGLLTGGLMLISPVMFARLGWRGAAQMSPRVLFWGGSLFFSLAIARPLLAQPGTLCAPTATRRIHVCMCARSRPITRTRCSAWGPRSRLARLCDV